MSAQVFQYPNIAPRCPRRRRLSFKAAAFLVLVFLVFLVATPFALAYELIRLAREWFPGVVAWLLDNFAPVLFGALLGVAFGLSF